MKKITKLSEVNIKVGVYVGPQIHKLTNDNDFEEKLIDQKNLAWKNFVNIVQIFKETIQRKITKT